MSVLSPAVHRAIVCVDVEGFGDRRRTNPDQVVARDGLYRALSRAFTRSGMCWEDCYHEDRGDGALILVPSDVPKSLLVTDVPRELASALSEHNQAHDRQARIRLRLAVHAGEIHHDAHGVAGTAINVAFRLLEADPLKRALAGSSGVLAVIASRWFFEEVIRHTRASGPASYRRVQIAVKETRDSAWICRPDDPYLPDEDAALPPGPAVAVPRQLPGAVCGFAGRVTELDELTGLLDTARTGGTVVISAIEGTAGIGKTAVAVHWAHQVADRFPDGQLYVNLRGFDPAGSPMTAAEAVRGFLDAFEVPTERIPVSLDAQAALYRSLLSARRVLVVLDNARDAGQVRPLLPGSPGCLVVVTSRNRLTSLVAAEGARLLTLDVLTAAEARQLLARRIGAARVAAEPGAIEEIATRCARLPLALAIVAARATAHPGFALTALAGELRDTQGKLDAFDGGEQATQVRAVFSWSCQQLTTEAARLFRLLGLHPGPDITTPAAASLAGVPPGQAQAMLAELSRAHLIAEHTPGRFTFHDLLRAYATEQVHARDPGDERRAAVHRMLDHYLRTAHTAVSCLHTRWVPVTLAPARPGATAQEFASYTAAVGWFDAEYPVLLRAAQLAAATTGLDACAWQLPWTLMDFFDRRGHWHDWVAIQRAALAAASRGGDRQGQAHAQWGLGVALTWLGQPDDAHTHLRHALRLLEELGDQAARAHIHLDLGRVMQSQGRPADALPHARQALALAGDAGDRPGQAKALNDIGWYNAQLGDHHQALTHCQQGLTLHRALGDRRGEAQALDSVGYAHHYLGHPQQALASFEQSLALNRELLIHSPGQAIVLSHLGDTHYATGDITLARDAWQQARDIVGQLGAVPAAGLGVGCPYGYPDADEIRAKLHRLKDKPRPGPAALSGGETGDRSRQDGNSTMQGACRE
jgi:tetratricopeptide (TPR) repeat protein